MADILEQTLPLFFRAWIPLFVAMDPIGLVPMFLGITRDMELSERQSVATQATVTAAAVSVGFMFVGKAILDYLGISVPDFQIAGGIILFLFAVREMFGLADSIAPGMRDLGVVPLGTPLIAGPATLTLLIMMMERVGVAMTVAAFAVNLFLVWAAFRYSHLLVRAVGVRGLRAVAKIIALLLAAYAISTVRHGLEGMGVLAG